MAAKIGKASARFEKFLKDQPDMYAGLEIIGVTMHRFPLTLNGRVIQVLSLREPSDEYAQELIAHCLMVGQTSRAGLPVVKQSPYNRENQNENPL